jgi:mitochondrial distribution and morphology protein 10
MLEFMDYVQHAFYNASHWNFENSYSQLTATARGKQIPRSIQLLFLNNPQSFSNSIPLTAYA